MELAVLC